MKKLLATLTLCLFIFGLLQAQNPYASLGEETDVLTLSEGKYHEHFPNEAYVVIGGVKLNTETGKVEALLEPEEEESIETTVSTRFLSVDPIGREYPQLTPYQYASNTPIQAIDLDGLEAWVVYRDFYEGNKEPFLTYLLDTDLEPIEGVYQVTRVYDENRKISGISHGKANWSEYPSMFPNEGNFYRADGKPKFDFELDIQILFGEVGWDKGDFGFEFGTEGNLFRFNASRRGVKLSSFLGSDSKGALVNKDRELNIGGRIGFVMGQEYRRSFDTESGKFLNKETYEVDFANFFNMSQSFEDGRAQRPSFKLGLPEIKYSGGVGGKLGLFGSFNPQPILTEYESLLKEALEQPSENPKGEPDFFFHSNDNHK